MKIHHKNYILALCCSLFLVSGCSSKAQREFNAALKTAQNGDAIAQMKVADFYFSGTGTDLNIDESVHWYEKAARQGHHQAFAWLMGQAYNNNAAANKVIQALQNEGNTLFAHWVLATAKQTGDSNAQYAVDWMYYTGRGLIKDRHQANLWFKKATQQNNLLAIKVLGDQHYFGETEYANDQQATTYLSQAANEGKDADAAMKMAHYYHYDVRDGEMARQWYAKAGTLGDADSKRMAESYDEWKASGPLQPNEPPNTSVDQTAHHE